MEIIFFQKITRNYIRYWRKPKYCKQRRYGANPQKHTDSHFQVNLAQSWYTRNLAKLTAFPPKWNFASNTNVQISSWNKLCAVLCNLVEFVELWTLFLCLTLPSGVPTIHAIKIFLDTDLTVVYSECVVEYMFSFIQLTFRLPATLFCFQLKNINETLFMVVSGYWQFLIKVFFVIKPK